MKKMIFSGLSFLLLLVAGCHSTKKTAGNITALEGTWELNYITGPRIAFDGLYPDKKPVISFRLSDNELGGNTSCNGFSSKIKIDGDKITVREPFAKTMMFCNGGGEETFLKMLVKAKKYSVEGNTLTFSGDNVALMRFTKITAAALN